MTVDVHCRLFAEDVAYLRQIAIESGIPWQVDLRLRVHRSCKGEPRDVVILREKK